MGVAGTTGVVSLNPYYMAIVNPECFWKIGGVIVLFLSFIPDKNETHVTKSKVFTDFFISSQTGTNRLHQHTNQKHILLWITLFYIFL